MKADISQKEVKTISAIPFFEGLDTNILDAIIQVAILQRFDAGQVVFLEGDASVGLYIVQEGWLKSIKYSEAGREQVIRFVGPGEEFGGIGVFADVPNQATVEALELSKVWIIQRDSLLHLMDKYPPLAHIIIQTLAKRVIHLMSLIEDLSLRSVVDRLARMFLEHSTGDELNRQRWATQTEMAARLGTVPDVLSRALQSLAEEGLIQIGRHQIKILDREGLERKAKVSS